MPTHAIAGLPQHASAVHLHNLRFSYPGKPHLLDIANWQIAAGEQVFLRGPSGSGKSTLLNLLAGILTPGSGVLEVLGCNLSVLSSRQRDKFRAQHIGVVFQQFNLVPYLSVLDNIRLAAHFAPRPAQSADTRARQLFAALHLDRHLLDQKAHSLSVGQQQRVAIARALINNPQLVIADEPTSALDSDLRDAFMQLLLEMCSNSGCTLLFVSHDAALAPHFARVADLTQLNKAGAAHHAV